MVTRINLKTGLIVVLVIICLPAFSLADQPIDVLKKSVDQGILILKDPAYKDADQKALQRQKLWALMQELYDFEEFSRRVLARNWRLFTPGQQAEFVELFGKFVNVHYLSQLMRKYENETVNYVGQKLINDSRAVVNIEIFWKDKNIPVEIKMLRRKGTWKVYDLSAMGITAISFYRSQFRAILRKKPPEHALALLRDKIKKAEKSARASVQPEIL